MCNITQKLRSDARQFFIAGIEAAEPTKVVNDALKNRELATETKGRIFLVAFGKAACPMVKEALRHVPKDSLYAAIAVTNSENNTKIKGCDILVTGHPVPDKNGIVAAKKIIALLKKANENDLVLVLISGGGSALLPCPPKEMSLSDKVTLNNLLLRSGFDINHCNMVRQQFSLLKGGGLARLAAPARVLALILSDVPGDDLRVVASGPTAPAIATPREVKKILKLRGLWSSLPNAAKAHIRAKERETQSAEFFDHVENILVGTNRLSVNAAIAQARNDYRISSLEGYLEGDVTAAASKVMDIALKTAPKNRPVAFICGGETTVIVRGNGLGGRNQELALRFAILAESSRLKGNWVFVSGGTDGRDGPTNSAGGLVDRFSLDRMRARGIDINDVLKSNDSYRALEASNDLLIIGGTGTNVADLQVLLIAPQ